MIATGEGRIIQYDLEEDSVWSVGIGCSGAVDILIERVDEDPLMNRWLEALERAEPAVLVKPLAGADGRLLVLERDLLGTLGDRRLDGEAVAQARARLEAVLPDSGTAIVNGAELFFEVNAPPPRLVIFGATGRVDLIWAWGDLMNGLQIFPNLVGVVGLSGVVARLLKEEEERARAGAGAVAS